MSITELDPALDGLEEGAPSSEAPPKKKRYRKAGDPGTYTHKLMMEAEQRPVVERCLWCPWKCEGPLVEARAASKAHREEKHQEEMRAARAKPKGKKKKPDLSTPQTAEDKEILRTLAERQRKSAPGRKPRSPLTDERWAMIRAELYEEKIGKAACIRRHMLELGYSSEAAMIVAINRRIKAEGLEQPPRGPRGGARTAKVEEGPPPLDVRTGPDIEGPVLPERPKAGSVRFMTEDRLAGIIRRYEAGEDLPDIMRPLWEEIGYKNHDSGVAAVYQAFRRRGVALRGRRPAKKIIRHFVPTRPRAICSIREAALWKLYEANIGVSAIGALVYEIYGFKHAVSGSVQVRKAFVEHGRPLRHKTRIDNIIPEINRREALAIVLDAEKLRAENLSREALEVATAALESL